MSARAITNIIALFAAFILAIVWIKIPYLSRFTLEGTAFLILVYFATHFVKKDIISALDGFIFTLVTIVIVAQTGGLSSPLFFLFYILLFGLSLLLEPISALIFSLLLPLLFFNEAKLPTEIIQISSLVFIAPIAWFFGRQYLQSLEAQEKIKVLRQKEKNLTQKLNVQEESTLLWLTLTFREHVTRITETSSNMLSDIAHLSPRQKEGLQKINESAKKLLQLGNQLKSSLEK